MTTAKSNVFALLNKTNGAFNAYLASSIRPALNAFLMKVIDFDQNLRNALHDALAVADAAQGCELTHDSQSVERIKAEAVKYQKLVRIYLVVIYGIDKNEARLVTDAIQSWAKA